MTQDADTRIRTQADLEAWWRLRIRPLGWSERRLWFWFLDADGRPDRQVQEITEMPDVLDAELSSRLMQICRTVVTMQMPGGSIAFLLARPGSGRPDAVDLAQAHELYAAARSESVRAQVIHLATDEDICPIPIDSVLNLSA